MGRPTDPPPSYRDDPDAVSLHTTPDDYAYADAAGPSGLPPSYTDSEADNTNPGAAVPIRHVPPPTTRTDHNSPIFKNGKPCVAETINVMDPFYDGDPTALESAIRTLANAAPTPLIYIMGTHRETVKKNDKQESRSVTDFRLVINLQRYLHKSFNETDFSTMTLDTVGNNEKTHRGTILKQRAAGSKHDLEIGGAPVPSLTEWCHRYCASARSLRVFRLRREITGFSKAWLRIQIEALIRSTNYRGNLHISFPVEEANIDIYTSTRINELRLKAWVCWIFYLTFLWLFTWPYLFLATKRYAVVRAEWPWWRINEQGVKEYTTVSEEQWWDMWSGAIKRLVLHRFQGEASEELMRRVMEEAEDPSTPGSVTGHAGVDGALGALSQGFQVARAIQEGVGGRGVNVRFGGRGGSGQGGWGYDC